jgi:heme oxygenase
MIACPFSHTRSEVSSIPAAATPLSQQLKSETADSHRAVEARLGLPYSIAGLAQYRDCLTAFYRLYRPLEQVLAGFREWPALGIDIGERAQTPRLHSDLQELGVDPSQLCDAPAASLPHLPGFAHALGALYVLEGSTLGGQIILRHLRQVLGDRIAGADAFFSGHAQQTGTMWNSFRASLDAYGTQSPETTPDAIAGAESTFAAVGDWMTHDRIF